MKYLMMIKHSEAHRSLEVPPSLYEAMGKFVEESFASGVLKDTAGLKASKDGGYRIRQSNKKLTLVDGPFAESKETVGGYAIVEGTEEQARKMAQRFMDIHLEHWPEFEGECEVRPVEDF